MTYDIMPGKAVGKLVFGMSIEHVRSVMGEPKSSVKVVPSDTYPADYFADGVSTNYDSSGKLQVVQFNGPTYPTFEGEDLGDVNPADWLSEHDDDAQIEPPDFTSLKLSIGFYDPEGDGFVVGVAKEGYYAGE